MNEQSTTVNTSADLLSIVRDLEPLLLAHARTADDDRKMAPEVMSALIDSGLLKMWVPRALGGMELPPNRALGVMEALARIDPATGWVVSNCVFISMLYQFLPPEALEDLLGKPDIVTCGSFTPPGSATENDHGYLVSGKWAFGSAIDYATSLAVLTLLTDDDGPVLDENEAPVRVAVFLDPNDVTVLDTWYTLGLRATGSTDYEVVDLELPRNRAYVVGPWEPIEGGPFAGPLYRLGLIIDAVRIAQVGVGIAQGALEDFVDLAAAKTPAYTAVLTADRATVQERVARAQALIQAGRHTLAGAVTEAWASVQDGPRIAGRDLVPMGLAASFALDASVQAVDLLYESAGSTAFRDEAPMQRRFRDLQTLRQNAIASWSRYESLGKFILGRESDWPWHQL